MEPGLRVGVVSAQSTMVRGCGEEDHVRTGMVEACSAEVAGGFGAGDAAFQGDAVTLRRGLVSGWL